MAVVPRVYNVANIFQGPADVYTNIVPPASSLTPTADVNTLLLDANGQPTTGVIAGQFHLGSVEGPIGITITEKVNEIMDDQHESAIDVGFDSIEAEIDIIIKEFNLEKLNTLLTAGSLSAYNALAATQVLQIGGQLDSAARNPLTMLLVSPDRKAAGRYMYILLYQVFLKSAQQITFHRSKENTFSLKFGAISDLTRVAGDELMQIVRQK